MSRGHLAGLLARRRTCHPVSAAGAFTRLRVLQAGFALGVVAVMFASGNRSTLSPVDIHQTPRSGNGSLKVFLSCFFRWRTGRSQGK
jgi:hypothetical protein